MKRVLNDLTPLPGNDLFITQYWFDKQTDPPLHFHEDYMLSLTLNVKGTRVTGQSVDNFTEKDLIHRQGQGGKTPCLCLLLSAERQKFSLKFVQFSTEAK